MSRRAAGLRLAGLAAALAAFVLMFALSGSLSASRVRGWLDGFGAAGPLVFIAVSASLTVVLFPGPVLAAASGLLFGTALGTPVSIAAATCAALLAFGIARGGGRDPLEELVGDRLGSWRGRVERNGFLAVLSARSAPAMPFTMVSYTAGLTRIRVRDFTAATAIGASPRAFAYTALGGHLGDLGSPEALAAVLVLVLMGIGGAVGAVAGWSRRRPPSLRLREH